ncbi:Arc family DNA-binding protein [Acinetobacter corruptisaponis]|uniref:Arc family DNA-binding protein n=1 Tax=Acinetobacter corruptisaponis TaxID=3045147 RepID=A0ABY8S579_9GAMM|nr:Arc family DNA-binding protein [Acinetobacter sp. KCTC 92772]WHP06845.1 Arc family DNA-binding protein [Acinetobacter sp. KCTC 92772]
MSDNPKHVTVRLRVPPELRDKIHSSAEQYNRSMNADMVARLEESFEIKEQQEFDKAFVLHVIEGLQNEVLSLTKLTKQLMEEKNKGA